MIKRSDRDRAEGLILLMMMIAVVVFMVVFVGSVFSGFDQIPYGPGSNQ